MQGQVQSLIESKPVIMFSKSYCPFCVQAKGLMQQSGIQYHVVEMDKIPNGGEMQAALKEISGQRTVPNTYINKIHIGGCDDLTAKVQNGTVKQICQDAGIECKL